MTKQTSDLTAQSRPSPAATPCVGRLAGRVALVTGGANGIGRAIATRLHAEGATVCVSDIDESAAADVAATLGGSAFAVGCDVTDEESVRLAVAAAVRRGGALDILACNVGVATAERFADLDAAAWHGQLEPTLHGTVRCIRAALAALLESRFGGAVVMTGSVNGMTAFGGVAYSAAKAALHNVAQNLSVEYCAQNVGPAHRPVRFNVVAPGTVRTRVWDEQETDPDDFVPLYPLGRIGRPADIAAAVAFLASDDAAWITGVQLPVDGGVLCGPARRFTELAGG